MDEDELEMLQEARARLANTQGKKAKRKDRERMLAQAKRLADLQKRRELKAAGLLSQKAATKARKRNRDIDLGVEIPFHKPAPAGLHDTSGEATRAESIRQKRWKSIDYKQINEQQYKTRDREAAQMRKREETRLKVLQDSNEKYKAAKETVEEERPARPRVSLQLPEPGITDQERQSYAKRQKQHMHQLPMEGERGDGGPVGRLYGQTFAYTLADDHCFATATSRLGATSHTTSSFARRTNSAFAHGRRCRRRSDGHGYCW